MAGLISVVAFDELWNVNKFLYYGVLASQNRGQDVSVVYVSDGGSIRGAEVDVNSLTTNRDVFSKFGGWAGIGATYNYSELSCGKHVRIERGGYEIALILDGVLNTSLHEVGERVLKLVGGYGYDLPAAFAEVVKGVRGVYALLALTNKAEVVAYRSTPGIKPLHIGGYGFDMVVTSSESTPITILGSDLKRALKPGEIIYMSSDLVKAERVSEPHESVVCAFEYIYMARHDSILDDIDVYDVRKSLGLELGRRFSHDIDVVVGVPETALPYALGFAKALGKDVDLGFIATGSRIRTAVKGDPHERLIGIQLKLSPIRTVFRGRRVAVVDDSLVRGLTIKNVIQLLRNKVGAKEVHVVIGSPKIMFGCPYGMDVPPRDELLAANLDDDLASKFVEADSITWLSVDDVTKIFRSYGVNVCLGCFLGKYPVEVVG